MMICPSCGFHAQKPLRESIFPPPPLKKISVCIPEHGKLFTVRHFMKMGINRSTLYGHMMREEQLKEEQGVEEKL